MKTLLPLLLLSLLGITTLGCSPSTADGDPDSLSGEKAATIYCQGCHALPQPQDLPRAVWADHVLPLMGAMLGQYPADTGAYSRTELLGQGDERAARLQAQTFPARAALPAETWQAIQDYYLSQAPTQLPDSPHLTLGDDLRLFQAQPAALELAPPSTTLLHYGSDGTLYLGDANSQRLYVIDSAGQVQGAARVREGAVHLHETPQALYLLVMGSFSPTDAAPGFFMLLPKDGQEAPRVLIPNLQRPVHSQLGDLNGDGLTDVLICEFGKWTGGLRAYLQRSDGSFQPQPLRERPGATRAYLDDWDQDGDLDAIALMAQGDEGVFYYQNDGQGQFTERNLLRFPPSYGSSYFALHDFNQDGLPDLLYLNGDNADYAPVPKPYHGLRLYLNRGDFDFELAQFLPLPGAYKALPADFDQDGDVDLAAISFFPDYPRSAGRESFVFFENQGDFDFQARSFPQADRGRWLTLTAGDPDQDGDLDLALGSLTFEVPSDAARTQGWAQGGLPYLWLENVGGRER